MWSRLPAPKGIIYEETPDGFSIDCTIRSLRGMLMVPLALVWWFLSFTFVYRFYLSKGDLDLPEVLFSVFFLLFAVVLSSCAWMMICGDVRFELRGGTLHYFSGI